MKQFFKLGMVLGSLFSFSTNVLATASFSLSCPQKFIATVTNVEDVQSSATLPKIEVDFQIIQTLKGENVVSKKIQVIKDGPVKFKSGEIYTVETNDIWLCSASLFSKI